MNLKSAAPAPRADDRRSVLYFGCPASERAQTERVLAGGDVAVVWADHAGYALAALRRRDMPVLIDLARGPAALHVVRELRAERPAARIFAVADTRRPDLTTEAVLTGVADVFARPPAARRLLTAIDCGAPGPPVSRRSDAGAAPLYAQADSMREVAAVLTRAAAMRAGVMIRGEQATGRQVVARAIHAAQSSSTGFVAVDCALAPGQLETELFGSTVDSTAHAPLERFSAASRLHAARGGTLYLRNIVHLPMCVQARLARVLRDREGLLIESGLRVSVDVRPIAAVDVGIDRAVQEGRIRGDLFKRLSVIRIDMPALRHRREDMPALVNYFLREICAADRVPLRAISRPAVSVLAALPWRGNAAELRSALESLVVATTGRGIGVDDVLSHVRLDGGAASMLVGLTLREARARFEREYIASVLDDHHGRVSAAAKALGIQRTNLYRKMRALRVPQERRH
jgi:two-component system nitrogen regulation response regulator NtrX